MKRLILCLVLVLMTSVTQAASPDFQEVYSILKTNLSGMTEKDLESAAVEGLLSRLANRALLVTNVAKASGTDDSVRPVIAATTVFDKAYGYIRLGDLTKGADAAVGEALHQLASTNQLKGMVVDLRFAKGSDHQGIFKVADCFFPDDKTIALTGETTQRSTGRSALNGVPVVILINRKTEDAVEVLAAALRAGKVGLLLGAQTAGHLSLYRDIPLSTGQVLQVATGEIKLSDGSLMPFNGVVPDIKVDVSLLDEQLYLTDAYRLLGNRGETNGVPTASTSSRLINEAELVRRHREGLNPDVDVVSVRPETSSGKVIRDPALARGLDLVKGLHMVREYRDKR